MLVNFTVVFYCKLLIILQMNLRTRCVSSNFEKAMSGTNVKFIFMVKQRKHQIEIDSHICERKRLHLPLS